MRIMRERQYLESHSSSDDLSRHGGVDFRVSLTFHADLGDVWEFWMGHMSKSLLVKTFNQSKYVASITSDDCPESNVEGKWKRSKHDNSGDIQALMGEILSSTRSVIGDVAASVKQPPPQPKMTLDEDDILEGRLCETLTMLSGLSLEEVMRAVCYLANNRNDMLKVREKCMLPFLL